ncbi:MAG TPA: 4Fe-4S dicluster domain-containing protein, partial [Methanomethylovorans sp.]|nr:4Fe-4S dicluster domain-containing protein [Methanomethylovorans sp.]
KLGGILRGPDKNFASQCTQCGQCLDACPQHLPIPQLLEKVVEEFEGPDLEKRIEFAKQLFTNDNF